jgi:hypothetical protein
MDMVDDWKNVAMGNPREIEKGTPYTALDKWLAKSLDWDFIVEGAEQLKRMIRLLRLANP